MISIEGNRRNTYIFSVAVIFILCFQVLFVTPRIGAANNGDFYRLAERIGINGVELFSGDEMPYNTKLYEQWKYKPFDFKLLTPAKQSLGNLWVSLPIRIITNIVGDTAIDSFFTYYMAIVYFILLLIADALIIRFLIHYLDPALYPWFMLLSAIMFLGSMHLGWFNSFFGEAMSYVGLFLLIGFTLNLLIVKTIKSMLLNLFCATISAYLFLTAKAQNVLSFPFVAVNLAFSGMCVVRRLKPLWTKAITCAVLVALLAYIGWSCIALYQWNGEYNEGQTLYSSIMYGALMLTDTPEESEKMLTEMGLDADLAADKGKHAYSDPATLHLIPESEEAEIKLYSKINTFDVLKYYITHPNYLFKAMEMTAQYAINPSVYLIQFQGGSLDDNVVERGRFTLWEKIRRNFVPHHFLEYVLFYLMFFSGALLILIRNKPKNNAGRGMVVLYIVIMLIGIAQYPLPFIGNGLADTNKQLYLFMLCWDITELITFFWVINRIYRRLYRRKKGEMIR